MSCRKKSFGRFAAIQLESDNCRKGMEYVPIWKKDFSAPPCLDVYKDGCGKEAVCKNPCNNVTPCSNPCNNVTPCSNPCNNVTPCSNPCNNVTPCSNPCNNVTPCSNPCNNVTPCSNPCNNVTPCSNPCNNVTPCSNPCNNVTPCHDWGYKKTCKKVESCVAGCSSSWSKPCIFAPPCYDNNYKAVDGCKSTRPFGGFPVVDLGSGKCGKPVNVHNPCSFLKPCHDIRRIWADSCGMQPCGKEAAGRFPCFKVKPEGACVKPDRERFCFN